jgi:hypothetical protein
MNIKQLLAKDIDRPLDGVIKASDDSQLALEVSEYVLTSEIARHLLETLDIYTAPGKQPFIGIWIAGFFGSGKSHLLKMLAHLLGDIPGTQLSRESVVAAFLDKVPTGDALLAAAINRCASIPAKSLLFNIDEKVDKNEKDQADALLKVFVQVFYELAGYFGRTPYIARFERDLESLGQLEQFKEAFDRHYGKPWEKGRELSVIVEPVVEKAYAEVTGTTLQQPLTAYRESYSVSIESFADEVAAWLDKQASGTRLGFFIDEVGQFIGQDIQMMLTLQTIVETLHTRCGGRAWVFVTSQETLDSILGDRTKQQELDFSKIQARFAPPLKLDSTRVKEVVAKRLLEKTEPGAAELTVINQVNHDRFRSLFAFQNQRTYENYTDLDDFVGIYPFVDYQFELFHDAMRGLSDFNAFTGKHASVGERSLLGVAKEIGSAIKTKGVGTLATFDMFFDGIEKSVLASVKRNISVASDNLTGPDAELAVRILKALLMMKYVDHFEATAQAITVLMTPEINANVAVLREQVERALQLLVANTYIQRTGSTYSYLTNDEQDVEKAIKALDRDEAGIKRLLNEEIVQASGIGAKVRHEATGVDLGIERFLDGERQGRSEALSIYFATPLGQQSLEEIQFQSVGQAGALFVMLDIDRPVLEDLDLFVRTNAYVQLQMKSTLPESRRVILDAHQRSNVERQREVLAAVREAAARAALVHNGSVLTVSGATAKERLQNAMQTVIEARYNRINEARAVANYQEGDVARLLRDEITLDLTVTSTLDTLTDAVIVQVRKAKANQVTSSVGSLIEDLAGPPFGWSMTTVLAAIAHGFQNGIMRLKLDSRSLVRTEIAAEIRNTAKQRLVLVEEIRAQDPAKIAQLQNFLNRYRDISTAPSNADDLMRDVRSALSDDLEALKEWAGLDYSFHAEVERALAEVEPLAGSHADDWYVDGFLGHTEGLLSLKDAVLDPVRAFLNGAQRSIVDEAQTFLDRRAAELGVAGSADVAALRAELEDPNILSGTAIPRIRQLHLALQQRLEEAVAANRSALRSVVEEHLAAILREQSYADATTAAQESARAELEQALEEVDAATSLGQVALAQANFGTKYATVVDGLVNSPQSTPSEPGNEPPTPLTTVGIASIVVEGVPAVLRTPTQAEEYVAALLPALLAAIAEGKVVLR